MSATPHPLATTTGAGRRSIATFEEYAGAQRAVDALSDRAFPVERVAIVGTGLRYVEQVSGRLTTGRAALGGAGQGALVGLFLGLLFGIVFTVEEAFLGVLVYSVALAVVLGAMFAAVGHAATGGRRDFSSRAQMQAERYDVQVDVEVADRATALLQEMQPRAAA
ncbi:MAG TPA: general stress protein [Solirubrobacteraceae bacterium]|nr:general stress protein [Solirubrobacteraceae bacterium]